MFFKNFSINLRLINFSFMSKIIKSKKANEPKTVIKIVAPDDNFNIETDMLIGLIKVRDCI